MRKFPKGHEPKRSPFDRLVTYLLTWVIGVTVAWMAVQTYGPALEVAFS